MKPRRLIVIRPFGPPHQVEQYNLDEMVRRELAKQEKRRRQEPEAPENQDAPLPRE